MLAIFWLVLGLIIGSFLNVCIWRLPRGESIIYPPSHCSSCSHALSWRDLVPVFSYLALRGRCRYCKARISPRYPLVEALTSGLFLFLGWHFGLSLRLPAALVFICVLEVAAFVDMEHQRIPNSLVLFGAVAGVVLNLLGGGPGWLEMVLAALAGGGVLWLVAVASRGGMGGGDVKLAAMAGLYLGWRAALVGLFLGILGGGVAAVILLATRRRGRRDPMPFGPFLAAGMGLALVWGEDLLEWYLNLLLY